MKLNLCSNCGFPADSKQDPDTSYFKLNGNVYCSLNCFFEVDKAKKEEPRPVKKKSKKKSKKK